METPLAGTSSWGRAAEALSRTFSHTHEKYHAPSQTVPSLQPRAAAIYSPDTMVFKTPEHAPVTVSNEGQYPLRTISGSEGQTEQGFHEHMDQYAMEQLGKAWDGLFFGDAIDDVRTGGDVYRALRGDLRTLACALKQSFGLMVDNRQYATGAGRSSVQQLQPCINELKSVAKDMASATRMATDNYNLQVELTLQKHASQHLLAQLHEAQLARMALEEEINALRAAGQRVTATESQLANLRQLNDDLQVEAQQARGELMEMRQRARELEERLEAQRLQTANLSARLREVELFEESGMQTPVGELYASSDGGSFVDSSGLAAVAAALGSAAAAAQATPGLSEHQSCPGDVGSRLAGNGGSGQLDGSGEGTVGAGAGAGTRQVQARDLPPELRRLIGKVLRRRDAEAAKLREDNALLTEELARLRSSAAAATSLEARSSLREEPCNGGLGASASTLAAGAATAQRQAGWRRSGDSWHTDDDLDWGSRPVTAEQGQAEPQRPRRHHQQQSQQHQQGQPEQQPQQLQPDEEQQGKLQHEHERLQQEYQQQQQELADAREAMARLQAEVAELKDLLQVQCKDTQAALQLGESLRERLAHAEAQAATQLQAAEHSLEQVRAERDGLAAQLGEAQQRHEALSAAADAASVSDAAKRQSSDDRWASDLAAARQMVTSLEAQLAAAVTAHSEVQGRLGEVERRERQARESAARELEATRQKLSRLQTDMRELRAEAQVARGEATAAWRDVKAANSEKLKAQGEMEEAVERLKLAEAARGAAEARLTESEAERRRLEERLAEVEAQVEQEVAEAPVTRSAPEAAGQEQELGPSGSAGGDGRSGSAGSEVEEAVKVARSELAAAEARLEEQRRASEAERERLQQQVLQLQQELDGVRQELAGVQTSAAERTAELEAQISQLGREASAAAAASSAAEQHQLQLEQTMQSLTEAQRRVAELEAVAETLRQQAEEARGLLQSQQAEHAQLIALAQVSSQQQLEAQKAAHEQARRELEIRHATAMEELQASLAEAESQLAAVTAVSAAGRSAEVRPGAAGSPTPSVETSASSSDAGMSVTGSPETARAPCPAGTSSHAVTAADARDGCAELSQGELDDDLGGQGDGDDLVMVRARCRAMQGELRLLRGKLQALVQVSEAAVQGKLGEAVAQAREAAAAGRAATDEEFWACSDEMHSLYALSTALRAVSLYAGPSGGAAVYGETLSDGAGGIVSVTSGALAARARHRLMSGLRGRCGQVAELLSEAAALVQLPRGCGGKAEPQSTSGRTGASSAGGAAASPAPHGAQAGGPGKSHGVAATHGLAAGPAAVTAPSAVRPSSGAGEQHPPGRGAVVGDAIEHRALPSYLGLEEQTTYCATYGRHAAGISDGGGHGLLLQPAGASSSFTSDTGSSLPDEDLVGLNNMYELPPMASPPKFEFMDLEHLTNLAL